MILWSLKKLENKLIDNKITETDFLNYLILYIITSSLSVYLYLEGKYNWAVLAEAVLIGVIIYFGIKECYKINKSIDGQNFHIRFFSLSIVIGIRLFIIMIPIYFIIDYIIILVTSDLTIIENNVLYDSSSEVAGHALGYYLLIKSFRRIKNTYFAQQEAVINGPACH